MSKPLPTPAHLLRIAHLPRTEFYNTDEWQRARLIVLREDPWCAWCGEMANTVDHIKDRLVFPQLAFARSNLQSMCASCHSKKTGYTRNPQRKRAAPEFGDDGYPTGKHPWAEMMRNE